MNKNILISAVIAVLAVAATLAGTYWLNKSNADSFRIATIDMDRVFKQSAYGQKINKDILSKRNELLVKFNAAKSAQEKAALQYENDKFSADQQKRFLEKAKATIAKVAKQKGFKVVTNISPQYYSELDLTETVSKDLK